MLYVKGSNLLFVNKNKRNHTYFDQIWSKHLPVFRINPKFSPNKNGRINRNNYYISTALNFNRTYSFQ